MECAEMNCPCCSSALILRGKWFICEGCGHRVYDIPERENHAYQMDFRRKVAQDGDLVNDGIDPHYYMKNRAHILHARVAFLDRHLPRNGMMWDFGCGGGYVLEHYQERFSVHGTEVDPLCLEMMKRHNIPACSPTFPRDYDVVMAWHSLEHTYDVGVTMDHLIRALKTKGLLVVEVPVDRYKYGDEFIGHRHEFTADSFKRLIARNELEGEFADGFQMPAVLFWGRKDGN